MGKRKNHSARLKATVALAAIREEKTLAELSKEYGVHVNQISSWKKEAVEGLTSVFDKSKERRVEKARSAEIDKLHNKIGQLVVERDFLAEASFQLTGTRGKK